MFSYFITGPTAVPSGTDRGVGPIPTAAPLAAGTYGITIADQVTGCASINTATVNDNAFTINSVTRATNCDPLNSYSDPYSGDTTDDLQSDKFCDWLASGCGKCYRRYVLIPRVFLPEVIILNSQQMDVFSRHQRRLFHKILLLTSSFNTANICNGTITAVTTPAASTYNWSASQSGSLTNPGNGATVTVNPGTWMLRVRLMRPLDAAQVAIPQR